MTIAAAADRGLATLRFRGTFRAYQQTVIDQAEAHCVDGRVHLVAPPGAGKTVIGLELARFFGRRAAVFAPTTTIQHQWLETVAMFSGSEASGVVSDDPGRVASINVYTYQLISTQERADEDFRRGAVRLWAETVVDEGQAETIEAALERIDRIRHANPAWYRREESRFRGELRRKLLRDDPSALRSLLHRNAQALVDELVAGGVGTVVLDECHHLLDYWALVIRFLVSRIDDAIVIGLTATPPDPETRLEEENYFALLGDVDFEVPTPALVRERTLAPYRDLVRFVTPTQDEKRFLQSTNAQFLEAVRTLTDSMGFRRWLAELLFGGNTSAAEAGWTRAVADDALLAFSAVRVMRSLAGGALIPASVRPPEIATQPPQFEDWILVIERYARDVLAPSADAADHGMQGLLRASLKPFGLTLTERGLRRGRSPVDRVVSLSDAKAAAAADILRLEHLHLGERLRVAVVCDYDREQARAALAGSLGAGSARGVFGVLARDWFIVERLCPLLVTATVLAVPAERAEPIRERLSELADAADELELALEPLEGVDAVSIRAKRGRWTPKRYVDLVTSLLERGDVRCLVGTRALLGEGWDAPFLNVLVDLTTSTTPQAVQQLRGRTIRLDPNDPHKVAHNWDVIAHMPLVPGGDNDLQRFLRRHRHTWGIVLGKEYARARDALELSEATPLPAPIERGPRHVDPELVADLERIAVTSVLPAHAVKQTQAALRRATSRSERAVAERALTRAAWSIGGPSGAVVTEATRVRLEQRGLRTSHYVATTTRSLVLSLAATFVLGATLGLSQFAHVAGRSAALVLLLSFVAGLALSAVLLVRTVRRLLVEEPPDVILLDIGRALAVSLAEAGVIAMNRDTAVRSVWCRESAQRELLVGLTGGGGDPRTFARCLEEVFAPGADVRYLVRRTDRRLPSFLTNAVWAFLRRLVRRLGAGSSADHFLAVPRVLARSRKRAETFARNWRTYVGGGELVDTRDAAAATAVLEARSVSRLQAIASRIERFGQRFL